MPRIESGKLLFIILVAVFVSAIIALFGFFAYPPPHGNSTLFIPAAVNFARGEGLINNISHIAQWIDETGGYRFLTYPPLFPIFLAFLMPLPDSEGVFLAVAFLQILIIAMSIPLLYKAATFGGKALGWFEAFLIGLSIIAIAAPFQSLSTRSDFLFQLIILLGALAALYLSGNRWLWAILGILLGAAAATHPMYIVLSLAIAGMFIAARHTPKRALGEMFGAFGLGLVVFLVIMAVTPFGIVEKMEGVMKHSGVYGGNGWFWYGTGHAQDTFAKYYGDLMSRFFLNPVSFFTGAFFLLFVAVGTRLYFAHRREIRSPFLFGGFLAFFSLALLTIVARPVSVYYFQMLSPLTFAAVIYATQKIGLSKAWKVAAFAALALLCVGFMRQAALFPFFLKEGVSLREARAAYEELKPDDCAGRCVGMASIGLWPLSEDYGAMFSTLQARRMGRPLGDMVDVILFQQNYSGFTAPPEAIEGCDLEWSSFVEKQPKFLGVKLANTMPGYSFAAYRCAR